MLVEPEFEDTSIVVLGDFNPPIFNPDWLARNEIVGSQAADNSKVEITHPELSQFRVGDLELTIDRQRFQVLTRAAPVIRLLDLVLKVFNDALPHTPMRMFGINRSVHFKVQSEELRNSIRRLLAPPAPWGEWAREIETGTGPLRGGMISLSMQAVAKAHGFLRKTTATVQPSALITNAAGIFVGVNDHFQSEERKSSGEILDALSSTFEDSCTHSGQIIDCIIRLKDVAHVPA